MGHPQDKVPEYLGVVCPTCGTRLHPRVRETADETTCPDCHTRVPVPSRQELEARLKKQREDRRPQPSAETYRLADSSGQASQQPGSAPPGVVTVICPLCQARLHPRLEEKPRRIKCPDCETSVSLPAREEAVSQKQSRPVAKSKQQAVGEGYGLSAAPPADDRRRRRSAYTPAWEAQAEIRRAVPPAVPRWTFFTGVFGFPWRPGALSRWTLLSLGFLSVGWVSCAAWSVSGRVVGYFGVVLAFFAMPLIWLSVWSFTYAAACGMTILQDTAAGNDDITEWPEPNWREWAVEFFHVAFILTVSAVLGYGIGRAALALEFPFRPVWVAATFVLFPILLLSALETGTVLQPISGPVLFSLLRLWWAWPVFYGVTAALWSGWAAAVYFALPVLGNYLTVLLAAPLLAAGLFISARLMGRLAWRISQDSEGDELAENGF